MNNLKKNFTRYLSMLLMMVTFVSAMPLEAFSQTNEPASVMSVTADGQEVILNEDGSFSLETAQSQAYLEAVMEARVFDNPTLQSSNPLYENLTPEQQVLMVNGSEDSLILPEPHLALVTAGGFPTLIVDLVEWVEDFGLDIRTFAVTMLSSVSTTPNPTLVHDNDFAALVFGAGAVLNASHSFRLSMYLNDRTQPLVIEFNGNAEVTYFDAILGINPDGDNHFDNGSLPSGVGVSELNETLLRELLAEAGNTPAQIQAAIDAILDPFQGVPPGGIFGPDWDNDLDVWNWPANAIIVRKFNRLTGELLPGARFDLIDISAGQQQPGGTMGTILSTFTTGHSGTVVITGLDPGVYMVVENLPPNNFTLSEQNARIARLFPDGFSAIALDFYNDPFGALQITLRDSVTNLPLADGTFRVTNSHGQVVGTGNGIFTTNNQGQILIPDLPPASYNIEQMTAPDGYRLGNIQTQNIFVNASGNIYNVDFLNIPPNTLTVTLRDSEDLQPLAGGIFRVTESGGAVVGTTGGLFTTNAQGQFTVTIQPNTSYIVEQMNPAPGHRLAQPVTQTIMTGQTGQNYLLDFTNAPYRGLVIMSLDAHSGDPLAGATYEIREQNGTFIGTFTSDSMGRIELTEATGHELLGWYEVTQIEVPAGFAFDAQPVRNVQVTTQANAQLTFNMPRQGSLEITLTSSVSPFEPLAGGQFEVRTQAGELLGLFTTNQAGGITIPNVGTGWMTIEPLSAPVGFTMDDPIRSVEVSTNAVARAAFTATPIASLTIFLTDANQNPLSGGLFVVRTVAGEELYRGTTGVGGSIAVPSVTAPVVIIEQLLPPTGYVMTDTSQTMNIVQGGANIARFINTSIANLTIELVDPLGNPLANGEFEVRTVAGELIHRGVTNQGGALAVPSVDAGTFIITQTQPSPGYVMTNPARTITIEPGQTVVERFVNVREAIVIIEKVDVAGNPLAGATFEIREVNGNLIHRGVTDNGGLITWSGLLPQTVIIEETIAPEGYIITEPARTLTLEAGDITTQRFVNERRSVFVVQKVDGDTGAALAGVVFELTTLAGQRIQNPLNMSFEFVTNNAGQITLPHLDPGTFVLTETRPLPGYQGTEPIVFSVGTDNQYLITVRNYRYPEFNINKVSAATGLGMQGVVFTVAPLHANGVQGHPLRNPVNGSIEWTTDANGIIRVPNMEHGTYIITEISTHPGYRMADPVIVVIDGSTPMTVTITNHRYSEWNLLNLDGHTNNPLQGGLFEVAHFWGTGTTGDRLRNPLNGTLEFVGGANGMINLGVLEPGTYIVTNLQAPTGFNLAEPVIFTVETDSVNTTVTIRNYRPANLTIQKINAITRTPLEGVVFEISRMDGTRVVNEATGFFDFVTDRNGLIHLPQLEDGNYILRETRALPGFIVDNETIHFTIDSSARAREHVLVVENTPASGLLVVVEDSNGNGIAGIEIEIRRPDGQIVTGQMLHGNQPDTAANSPHLAPNGNFITNASGRVNLNHITPGVYHIRLVNAPNGINFDSQPHVVTVLPGQQAVLNITLESLAGLRLTAVNSITGNGIFNVEFMVFDSNNHNVGVFRTDNNGIIDFSHLLNPGRYTIRVTSVPSGFTGDEIPRTVEFVAGRVTEVEWAFTPQAGQIQITVVSGDDNFNNALPAGTPLEGAIFEVFDQRTGNVVDRFISGRNGIAVSSPLPLGRYLIRQVQAPAFYMINPNEMDIDIQFESQIVRMTWPNFSANIAVHVRQSGPAQQAQGQPVVFDIREMRNDSTVPLEDFYWRSTLPVQAVRADRLVTGTYNQALQYRVLGVTNTGRDIVIAENLSTTRNNVIELRPAMLGLSSNEFVTELTIHFGQVPAGFMMVEQACIFTTMLPTSATILPNNMEFAHLVDVGGRIVGSDEWSLNNHPVGVVVWSNQRMPQSGW